MPVIQLQILKTSKKARNKPSDAFIEIPSMSVETIHQGLPLPREERR